MKNLILIFFLNIASLSAQISIAELNVCISMIVTDEKVSENLFSECDWCGNIEKVDVIAIQPKNVSQIPIKV